MYKRGELPRSLNSTISELSEFKDLTNQSLAVVQEKGSEMLKNQETIKKRMVELRQYANHLSTMKEKFTKEKRNFENYRQKMLDDYYITEKELKQKFEDQQDEIQNIKEDIAKIAIQKHAEQRKIEQFSSQLRVVETRELNIENHQKPEDDPTELINSLTTQINGLKVLTEELDSHTQQVRDIIISHNSELQFIQEEKKKELLFLKNKGVKISERKQDFNRYIDEQSFELKRSKIQNKNNQDLRDQNKETMDLLSSKYNEIQKKIKNLDSTLKSLRIKKDDQKLITQNIIDSIKETRNDFQSTFDGINSMVLTQKKQKVRSNQLKIQILGLQSQIEVVRATTETVNQQLVDMESHMEKNQDTLSSLELNNELLDMNEKELSDMYFDTLKQINLRKKDNIMLLFKVEQSNNELTKQIDDYKRLFIKNNKLINELLIKLKAENDEYERKIIQKEEDVQLKKESIERKTLKYEEMNKKMKDIETDLNQDASIKKQVLNAMELLLSRALDEIKSWRKSSNMQESRLIAWKTNFLDNVMSCSETLANGSPIKRRSPSKY